MVADLERLVEAVRVGGRRVTAAKRAVLAAMLNADDHLTADEVAHAVRAAHPDVHRSTIYRCLDAFEDLGVIEHVHLGHGPAVYHLVEEAHHHLVCDACGAIVEVPPARFGALARALRRDYGFRINARHFAIPGRCANCEI